ncbi:trypsin-like peptidase domain-containing protein [Candidatus Peregrinibacteria bacterium]|nr:trypsin-like peptidase domain-containing protein [Candidatus Peregrinibacteria bacterium]
MVEESSIIDSAKKVGPAVVSIVITKDLPLYRQGMGMGMNDFFFNFNDPFGGMPFGNQQPYQQDDNGNIKKTPQKVGGGSGFIVTADGLVLTNKHVVDDLEAGFTVITTDGTEYPAELVSKDTINDIAVLRMKDGKDKKAQNLPTVELGSSGDLQIGQRVVAIGNALAEYQNSVTTGIISGKGRQITAGSASGSENLMNLLQTDAAINPGNSGGPLVNLAGQVVGINTAMANGAQSIGFAIPIDDIKPLIQSIMKNGRIVRPFLGVRYLLLDEAKAKELKIDVKGGALLVGKEEEGQFAVVPGSPAEKAGLKIKDVILEVDGTKVADDSPLQTMIATKAPGDTVTLKIWRSGKTMEVKVTLEEAKN